jgi:ferrous iron transport protein B
MAKDFRSKLDRVLKIWDYVIFLCHIIHHFQSIFDWSKAPMDFIDSSFASLSSLANNSLPAGVLTNLISRV